MQVPAINACMAFSFESLRMAVSLIPSCFYSHHFLSPDYAPGLPTQGIRVYRTRRDPCPYRALVLMVNKVNQHSRAPSNDRRKMCKGHWRNWKGPQSRLEARSEGFPDKVSSEWSLEEWEKTRLANKVEPRFSGPLLQKDQACVNLQVRRQQGTIGWHSP